MFPRPKTILRRVLFYVDICGEVSFLKREFFYQEIYPGAGEIASFSPIGVVKINVPNFLGVFFMVL